MILYYYPIFILICNHRIKKQEDKIVYEIIKIHLEKLYRRLEENANSCHEITIVQKQNDIYMYYLLPSSPFF